MKKIIYVISPFIAFFLGFIFLKLSVHAQAAPQLSQSTLTVIEGGNNSLISSGFSTQNVFPTTLNYDSLEDIIIQTAYNPILQGVTLSAISSDDYNVRSLTSDEIDSYENVYPNLYNLNGDSVSWDNVYYVSYDNGVVHGQLYVDSDGNILSSDNLSSDTMFKLGLGGNLLGVSDWANIYDEIGSQLFEQEYNISLNNTDLSNVSLSYYLHGGRVSSGRKTEWIIYVPNIYSQGVSVGASYTNGQSINNIYYNDGAGVVAKAINTNGGQPYQIHNTTVTKDGFTYSHNLAQSTYIDGSNNNRSAFESGTTGRYNFSLTSFTYNTSLLSSAADTFAFKRLDYPENVDPLDINEDFDYNSIKELEIALNTISPTVDNQFDPSSRIDEFNYPYDYPVSNTPNSSTLPFPSTNAGIALDPSLNFQAVTQPATSTVYESFFNFQIPFVENLFSRYPFCIPWDIKHFFEGFTSTPQAPAWDFDYSITVLGETYTTHFEGDLSDFDSLARIFRNLVTISFIIFLAVYSYFKHS